MNETELESFVSWLGTASQWIAVLIAAVGFAGAAVGWLLWKNTEALERVKEERVRQEEQGMRLEIEKTRMQAEEAEVLAKKYEAEIAGAKKQAAEAEKVAAEARLELAKLRDPRRLLPEQQEKILTEVKNFAGQKFSFNVYPDPEPLALLRTLDVLLKSAGWQRVPSQLGDMEMEAAGSTAGVAYDSGVKVFVASDDNDSRPALKALADALTKEGLPCLPHTNTELIGKTPRAILINVGKKP